MVDMKLAMLVAEYSENEITINELIEKTKSELKKFTEMVEKKVGADVNSHENRVTKIGFSIRQVARLFEMQKLDTNKQDGLVLLDYFKELVQELEDVFKEEK